MPHPHLFFTMVACIAFPGTIARASDSPLADAAERQHRAAALALVDEGVDVNSVQVDGMTALHWAVYHEDAELAKRLVAAGADVNAENRYGVRPLSIACQNGNSQIVELLLAAGADPNLFSEEAARAVPPLFAAAYGGSQEAALMLIDAGADTTMRSPDGFAPSDWADTQGHRELAELLRSLGT